MNLTTDLSAREYAVLSAEAERQGMTVDELATQLARDAMQMRYRKNCPGKSEIHQLPMEKNRASKDPAGGRQIYESEKSETAAQAGTSDIPQ